MKRKKSSHGRGKDSAVVWDCQGDVCKREKQQWSKKKRRKKRWDGKRVWRNVNIQERLAEKRMLCVHEKRRRKKQKRKKSGCNGQCKESKET